MHQNTQFRVPLDLPKHLCKFANTRICTCPDNEQSAFVKRLFDEGSLVALAVEALLITRSNAANASECAGEHFSSNNGECKNNAIHVFTFMLQHNNWLKYVLVRSMPTARVEITPGVFVHVPSQLQSQDEHVQIVLFFDQTVYVIEKPSVV